MSRALIVGGVSDSVIYIYYHASASDQSNKNGMGQQLPSVYPSHPKPSRDRPHWLDSNLERSHLTTAGSMTQGNRSGQISGSVSFNGSQLAIPRERQPGSTTTPYRHGSAIELPGNVGIAGTD